MLKRSGLLLTGVALSGYLLSGCMKAQPITNDLELTSANQSADQKQIQNTQKESNMNQAVNLDNLPATPFSKLEITTIQPGTGATVQAEDQVSVHYTGFLIDGTKFDSSVDRGQPFTFQPGTGQVIQGWDEGVVGLQEGGKYRLFIPSAMAYGPRGAGAVIGPNADLVFDIEVVKVN